MPRINNGWRLGAALVMSLLIFHCIGSAQPPEPNLQGFEVATIKPASPYSPYSDNLNFNPNRVEAQNMSLRYLLIFAYGLTSDRQLIGGPKWVDSAKFEINAKVDQALTEKLSLMSIDDRTNMYRSMFRGLLADRFQLRVHHEKREMSVLALTVAKSGSKLEPAKITDIGATLHNPGPGRMEATDVPIKMLVSHLSTKPEIGGRMVVDKTGLTGKYDFTLTWTPEGGSGGQSLLNGKPIVNAGEPSLFTALREQLGLELKSTRAPVDVVVIDQVEMPSPN